MASKKKYRGVSRARPLTNTESKNIAKIREEIMEEIPPVKSSPEKVAIAKLRAERQAKGITLTELAKRTGITRGTLARLESQKNATLRTLARYANGLGCSLELHVVPNETVEAAG